MAWNGPDDTSFSVRRAALAPALQPTERRVVERIAADRTEAVDSTAQQLADRVGVGRASVIRTAQTLGYAGYPQMRVALAAELTLDRDDGSPADVDHHELAAGAVSASIHRIARTLPRVAAALSEEAVEETLAVLDRSRRVLLSAAGLSAPLGLSTAMRLGAADRPAEFVPDPMSQLISARGLETGSACLVISASGANPSSLDVAVEARDAGATVLALTSFTQAPLVDVAHTALIVPTIHESYADELVQPSRAALTLVLESLVEQLVARRGRRGRTARTSARSVVGDRLSE